MPNWPPKKKSSKPKLQNQYGQEDLPKTKDIDDNSNLSKLKDPEFSDKENQANMLNQEQQQSKSKKRWKIKSEN